MTRHRLVRLCLATIGLTACGTIIGIDELPGPTDAHPAVGGAGGDSDAATLGGAGGATPDASLGGASGSGGGTAGGGGLGGGAGLGGGGGLGTGGSTGGAGGSGGSIGGTGGTGGASGGASGSGGGSGGATGGSTGTGGVGGSTGGSGGASGGVGGSGGGSTGGSGGSGGATGGTGGSSCNTLLVNEVASTGPAGGFDEYVEIHNYGTCTAPLTGWVLKYGSSSGASQDDKWTGGGSDFLAAGGYFVIAGANFPGTKNASLSGAGLGDDGGVGLFDPKASLIDSVAYGSVQLTHPFIETSAFSTSATSVMSVSRSPNGTDTNDNSKDFALSNRSPGAAN